MFALNLKTLEPKSKPMDSLAIYISTVKGLTKAIPIMHNPSIQAKCMMLFYAFMALAFQKELSKLSNFHYVDDNTEFLHMHITISTLS
jgi:hypothetical protein